MEYRVTICVLKDKGVADVVGQFSAHSWYSQGTRMAIGEGIS